MKKALNKLWYFIVLFVCIYIGALLFMSLLYLIFETFDWIFTN